MELKPMLIGKEVLASKVDFENMAKRNGNIIARITDTNIEGKVAIVKVKYISGGFAFKKSLDFEFDEEGDFMLKPAPGVSDDLCFVVRYHKGQDLVTQRATKDFNDLVRQKIYREFPETTVMISYGREE